MSIVSDLISPVNHNDQLQIQQSRVMLSNCLFPPHTDIIWLRGSRVLDTGPGEEQGLVARQILLGSLVICENQHLISAHLWRNLDSHNSPGLLQYYYYARGKLSFLIIKHVVSTGE